jgi:ribonuclease HI
MRFKGQVVLVRVDDSGKPVLDGEGRAEMKYREGDQRTYRPGARNIEPAGAGDELPPPAAARAPSARRPRTTPSKNVDPALVINVWTDGACSGNPGPMGIGVVVLANGKRREHGEYLGVGTNNIAELVAIERGLSLSGETQEDRAKVTRIHTDSSYAIGVLSMGWKAKANQELIARLRGVLAERPGVELIKVPGHSGVPENERCDQLAREAVIRRR